MFEDLTLLRNMKKKLKIKNSKIYFAISHILSCLMTNSYLMTMNLCISASKRKKEEKKLLAISYWLLAKVLAKAKAK